MNRYFALVLVLCLASALGARAQGLDERYVQVFNLIQEGDGLVENRAEDALNKYVQAQAALKKIQSDNATWNAQMVGFRLQYVAEKIRVLTPKVHPQEGTTPGTTNQPPPAPAIPAPPAEVQPGKVTAPNDWDLQLNNLKDQVHQLQLDKQLLEAKLKEAFAAQPAATDPKELARAEEKILTLQKENELIKLSLEKSKSIALPGPAPSPVVDTKPIEQAQQALAEANRQLAAEKERSSRLAMENGELKTRTAAGTTPNLAASPDADAALRTENELLKKQVVELQKMPVWAAKGSDVARQLTLAQAKIAALQSDQEVLRLEKVALQNRIATLSSTSTNFPSPTPSEIAGDTKQLKQLESERDDLKRKLEAANKAPSSQKDKSAAGRITELQNQMAILQLRVDAYEAKAVPYTPEELAMLKVPEAKLPEVATPSVPKSVHELSPEVSKLVLQARNFYQAGQLDKAESTYREALKSDDKNVSVLANLASVELEAGHLEAADANIKQALTMAPDQPYNLTVLGRVRFSQGKYDESVEALSHAAKLEPDNAEVQNFLGLALTEKGMRGAAEAALRKAIQLQPNYANAHHNLAVVYITAKPPATQLARWHYQRALAAGSPPNLKLEKLINDQK